MTNPPPKLSGIMLLSLVAIMWGAYFLNYCDRQAVFAMFPVLKKELAMSDWQLGLTGTIFLWVYGIGCPIAGQLADRYSKRMLVTISLAIWSVVTLATGFAYSAWYLLALRALMGISESLYMPAAIALTADATPADKRSRAVSLLTTAQIAGTVGGAWFGGWMAENGYWRAAFFCLGAIGLLYAIPYYLFLLQVNDKSEHQTGRGNSLLAIVSLAQIPTFYFLCFAFPVFVFGLWMLYSWLPSFLQEKFSLGLTDAAFNASVYMQIATLIGLLTGGFLADFLFRFTKASRIWLLVASLLLCAPCLVGIGYSETLSLTRFSLAAFGLFAGFLMGNIFPAAFEVVPSDTRASAVGILNFFGSALSGFAPLVVGTWKKTVGIDHMLAYTSIAYLIAAAVLIISIVTCFQYDWLKVNSTKPSDPSSK